MIRHRAVMTALCWPIWTLHPGEPGLRSSLDASPWDRSHAVLGTSSPTSSSGTAGGQVRGLHPERQGHRPAEPAAQGRRPEPALVRDRGPGLRADRVDADARPDRQGPPLGNRSGCACASSPSAAAGAGCGSDSPNAGPGPGSSPPRPPACRPSRLADQPEQPRRPGRRNRQGPWNPPTRRDSRASRHGHTLKINPSRTPQATKTGSRKIEVRSSQRRRPDLPHRECCAVV
jgi:hypothetical protein